MKHQMIHSSFTTLYWIDTFSIHSFHFLSSVKQENEDIVPSFKPDELDMGIDMSIYKIGLAHIQLDHVSKA